MKFASRSAFMCLAMRSKDAGGHWEKLVTNTKRNLLNVAFGSPQVGVAVGDFGTLGLWEYNAGVWSQVSGANLD